MGGSTAPIQSKPPDLESLSLTSRTPPMSDQHSSSFCRKVPDTVSSTQQSTLWLRRLRNMKPSKEIIYNAILGTSDGMTVPFAVTASLAGVADARLVMMAGLAELIAGAISMAAGGVLGAKSDVQGYNVAARKLSTQLTSCPDHSLTTQHIHQTFASYNLPPPLLDSFTHHIVSLPQDQQSSFLLRFTDIYHDASPPSTSGCWKIALVLGLAYFSGILPLIPYMVVDKGRVNLALYVSVGISVVLLAVFGYGKTAVVVGGGWGWSWGGNKQREKEVEDGEKVVETRMTVDQGSSEWGNGWLCVRGAIECLVVVGLSAGLSVVIIRGIGRTL